MKRLLLLVIIALGLTVFDVTHAADVAPTQRPNIILVMADDLGWSDIGCYGGEIHMPHIDSLARDGLRFTQFYNNSISGPTRASLLTGLYCQQVGNRGDRWNEPKDFSKCVTVAELLQAAGYRTMMVGKWQGRDLAADRGFDRFFGPLCQAKISYFHEVEQNPYLLDRDRWELAQDFYLTDAINDFAVQFLEEAVGRDQPFFLYVAHIAPHWPLHAREVDIAPYRQQYRDHGWGPTACCWNFTKVAASVWDYPAIAQWRIRVAIEPTLSVSTSCRMTLRLGRRCRWSTRSHSLKCPSVFRGRSSRLGSRWQSTP